MSRSFADFLGDLGQGRTHIELSDALAHLVGQVSTTRCSGSLTLTLKVKPNGEHGILITPEVKTKEPVAKSMESAFYIHGSGDLFRNDPRQPDLPLRVVSEPERGPLKEVPHA